jgi:hypothetical protein
VSQTQCVRIPLRPEGREEFLAFARELRTRRAELLAVLAEEGLRAEAVFLDDTGDEAAVVIFTRAEDLAAAHAAYERSGHPIQVRMRQLQGSAFDLGRARPLEVLLDLTGDVA